ncbi:hypothetical protein ARMGADRAFT_480577 [Armillaria gallica]|uniref:Uncharacterized protein n=1 Tax=Armillaria gallica TaxID=47427 RepID=A0A2H3D7J3_ARMGA|nr:hypothetical protein ARMGADRAFT_480577 [Armillaria gallica]
MHIFSPFQFLSFPPLLRRLQVISYRRPTRLRRVSRRGIPRWLWSRDCYQVPFYFIFFLVFHIRRYVVDRLSRALSRQGIIVGCPQTLLTTNNYTPPLVSILIMTLASAPDTDAREVVNA